VALTRRHFLTAGAVSAGVLGAGAVGLGVGHATAASELASTVGTEPFFGAHQAGIATAQQDRLLFAAFDVTTSSAAAFQELLAAWTLAAARMAEGLDATPEAASVLSPPSDTGEATGLDQAHLTITFGFGPGLFDRDGNDRFGLRGRRPAALADLPGFPGDQLEPSRSGGDLCVQACSNDPQVAYHAVRNLTRIARGKAVLRWTQEGFGRTASTTPDQVTPRNLMGFKDGTNNLRAGQPDFDGHVWVTKSDGPDWMVDGTYLVARRIRMHIEVWDRSSLQDQEQTIGRTKLAGAPLGSAEERDPVDLGAKDANNDPVIPTDAHIRLSNQEANAIFLLRRGYSFTDGIDPQTGQLDAGLFFLAFQRDPRTQFVPLQQTLATQDALNEYIQHVGSAVFAVPPGVPNSGQSIGATLFG
jgi:deferrochelatase/peroxidase EfeB